VAEAQRLIRFERDATVQVIAHIAEIEKRRIHLTAGYPSLFAYCADVLRLSEHEAYHRILAARTANSFPRILDMLADARVNLTTVRLIAQYLTPENHEELLAAAAGKTRSEVELLIAARFPKPDVPTSVRRLPAPTMPAPSLAASAHPPSLPAMPATIRPAKNDLPMAPPLPPASAVEAASVPASVAHPPAVRPLAAERYHVSFTASADTIEKLRLAQDLLGHAVPSGDVSSVFDRALTVLVEDLTRRKFAGTERPRASGNPPGDGRHIPADVRRAVWKRDGGRCAFMGKEGHRCGARRRLEFHHVKPFAEGGRATIDNLRLVCAAHNRHEAEVFYEPSRQGRAGLSMNADRPIAGGTMRPTRPGPSWLFGARGPSAPAPGG